MEGMILLILGVIIGGLIMLAIMAVYRWWRHKKKAADPLETFDLAKYWVRH